EGILPLDHGAAVHSAVFSSDGRWIASGGQDGNIKLWDARTGRVILSFQAHQNHVRCVAFSPDGRFLASASWDKTVKVWSLDEARAGKREPMLIKDPAPRNRALFSPDGTRLAAAGGDAKLIRVWDVTTGEQVL